MITSPHISTGEQHELTYLSVKMPVEEFSGFAGDLGKLSLAGPYTFYPEGEVIVNSRQLSAQGRMIEQTGSGEPITYNSGIVATYPGWLRRLGEALGSRQELKVQIDATLWPLSDDQLLGFTEASASTSQ